MRVENTSMVHLGQDDCIRHKRKGLFILFVRHASELSLIKRSERIGFKKHLIIAGLIC
jgi:hypothetical protein